MANEIIRPTELPVRTDPVASEVTVSDNGSTVAGVSWTDGVNAAVPVSSQFEAEAGVNNSNRMTPLTTKQAIDAQVGPKISTAIGSLNLGSASQSQVEDFATAAQGFLADTALQPGTIGSTVQAHDDFLDALAGMTAGSAGQVIAFDINGDPVPTVAGTGDLVAANNLSDVDSPETSLQNLGAGESGIQSFKAETPFDLRVAANVRGKVNFFDFLQETRSSSVREQIANGTFTGDLATEWQAFRDALWAIYDDGGRPYGFIPECKIHSSVAPNFAMDYLTLDTQGHVRIEAIGAVDGFVIDGMGLGQGRFGVRAMNVGPLCASTAAGLRGVFIRRAHKSNFWGVQSLGGTYAGIQVDGCVTSEFHKPLVTVQMEPFLTVPPIGLYVAGSASEEPIVDPNDPSEAWKRLLQTSWCKFEMPVIEYVPVGIQLDDVFGCKFHGGTSEANGTALIVNQDAWSNKFDGIDFEANSDWDVRCWGQFTSFIAIDSQGPVEFNFGAHSNTILGGHWADITLSADAKRNFIGGGASVNSITDNYTGSDRNRIRDVTDNSDNWRDRWISSSPTVLASTGTLGAHSSLLEYKIRDGDTVDFQVEIAITTNDSGAGFLRLDLPITPVLDCAFSGAEIALSNKGVIASAFGGNPQITISFADGAYPGADGAAIVVQGTYRRG